MQVFFNNYDSEFMNKSNYMIRVIKLIFKYLQAESERTKEKEDEIQTVEIQTKESSLTPEPDTGTGHASMTGNQCPNMLNNNSWPHQFIAAPYCYPYAPQVKNNLTLMLSAFENLNDITLIQNWLISRLFANIFHHLIFAEELKCQVS